MDIYATDEEKVESLRKWWKENGKSVIIGIIIGLGVVFGWRGWMDYKQGRAEQASALYEQLLTALDEDAGDIMVQRSELLIERYKATPYADLAGLALAKHHVKQGDPAAAQIHLQRVMDNAKQEEIRHIARLRLARVLFELNKLDEALALISDTNSDTFTAAHAELKGDIHVAQGIPQLGRDAYQKALVAEPANRNFLELKLDDLGIFEQQDQ